MPVGASGLSTAPAPSPGSPGCHIVPRAQWDPQAGLSWQPPVLSSHPHSPAAAAFDSGQPRCDSSGRSSQNPYPWWRAGGAWGTSCSAPSGRPRCSSPPSRLPLALRSGKGMLFAAPRPKLLSDVPLLLCLSARALPVSEGPPAQPRCLPTPLLAVEQLRRAAVGSP